MKNLPLKVSVLHASLFFLISFSIPTGEQDDYDNHNLHGRDSDYYVMFVGIGYVLVSFGYLALTGELFSFTLTEDETPDAVAKAESNVGSTECQLVALWW